jgi:hypothetical protein
VPDTGGYRLAEVRGLPVAGIMPLMQSGAPAMWATYIATDDADATAKAVAAGGGQTFVAPMDVLTEGRMAVFADPSGAVFGAWQAGRHIGAGIVNEPGALSWNELATRQPELAIPFYAGVFGWGESSEGSYTSWTLGGRPIGGMDDSVPAEVPAQWRVYFAVADTDATVATVAESGGSVVMAPMDIPQGRIAALADPQGASFCVIAMAG